MGIFARAKVAPSAGRGAWRTIGASPEDLGASPGRIGQVGILINQRKSPGHWRRLGGLGRYIGLQRGKGTSWPNPRGPLRVISVLYAGKSGCGDDADPPLAWGAARGMPGWFSSEISRKVACFCGIMGIVDARGLSNWDLHVVAGSTLTCGRSPNRCLLILGFTAFILATVPNTLGAFRTHAGQLEHGWANCDQLLSWIIGTESP